MADPRGRSTQSAEDASAGPRALEDIDAVLLDAGGVIIVPDPVGIAGALRPHGTTVEVDDLIRAHYVAMRAHAGSDHDGEGAWRDYLAAYVGAAGVPDEGRAAGVAAFVRVFGHHAWRFPLLETIAAMERLRALGLPLGVVSNAVGQVEGVLRNVSACQVGPGGGVPVEIVVDSGVVGVEKPDPAVFAPALAVLAEREISPDRTAYVGDSLRYDVLGARNAGLVPMLLDPYDLHADLDIGPGAHRIRSVHDLLPPPARPEADPADAPGPEAG